MGGGGSVEVRLPLAADAPGRLLSPCRRARLALSASAPEALTCAGGGGGAAAVDKYVVKPLNLGGGAAAQPEAPKSD